MDFLKENGVEQSVIDIVKDTENRLKNRFEHIDLISENNFYKVLAAFRKNKISYECMNGSTGYGYDDIARDSLERVYADIFRTEAALVRPQITCGTHAITTALFGVLRPGDELISAAGPVYDTLEEVIGIRPSVGSLSEFNISFRQIELLDDGSVDFEALEKKVSEKTRMVTIQRSRGYSFRPTLSCQVIEKIIKTVKSKNPDCVCFVDNCYGEFAEEIEPTYVGADLMAGSLIKNPGGGLAPTGGYIVGKKNLIDMCASRLSTPGLLGEVGASLSVMRSFYQGIYFAPGVVAAALKGAILSANVYERLGFKTNPTGDDERFDIIQAIELKSEEAMRAFCLGIQKASAIDSHVVPSPGDMPGYESKVIMAAGAFISGSSLELSADGPIRKPYNIYLQGGLTYPHAKLGVIYSLQEMINAGCISLGD